MKDQWRGDFAGCGFYLGCFFPICMGLVGFSLLVAEYTGQHGALPASPEPDSTHPPTPLILDMPVDAVLAGAHPSRELCATVVQPSGVSDVSNIVIGLTGESPTDKTVLDVFDPNGTLIADDRPPEWFPADQIQTGVTVCVFSR